MRDRQTDKPVEFYLTGASLDTFCRSYIEQWAAKHGGHTPPSEVIDDYCDRTARWVEDVTPAPFVPRVAYPWKVPPGGNVIAFSEVHNSYYCFSDGKRMWWSYDDEGNRGWHANIRTETTADRLRIDAERRSDPARYRAIREGKIL